MSDATVYHRSDHLAKIITGACLVA
uniref:Uncharacterized protein n=1 Tax=Rhizophora mucronata TaxID=61149 RepID=A0A2P2NNA8_RHIMU